MQKQIAIAIPTTSRNSFMLWLLASPLILAVLLFWPGLTHAGAARVPLATELQEKGILCFHAPKGHGELRYANHYEQNGSIKTSQQFVIRATDTNWKKKLRAVLGKNGATREQCLQPKRPMDGERNPHTVCLKFNPPAAIEGVGSLLVDAWMAVPGEPTTMRLVLGGDFQHPQYGPRIANIDANTQVVEAEMGDDSTAVNACSWKDVGDWWRVWVLTSGDNKNRQTVSERQRAAILKVLVQ